jgi:uncharacterized protein
VLRAVVDPGVLIAALISKTGPPVRFGDYWRAGAFDLVVSRRLLDELDDVLSRAKFRPYVTEAEVRHYRALVSEQAVVVKDPEFEPGLTPDPEDDYLVALARAADADVIVSGDRHLTELVDARPPVLTAREFVARLQAT